MNRRSARGLGPLGFVAGALVSFFFDLVGWCVTHSLTGVLVVMAVTGLVIWAVASEIRSSDERTARADQDWARHYTVTYDYTAPQRHTRRKGGAR